MRTAWVNVLAWCRNWFGPIVIADSAGCNLVYGWLFKRPRLVGTPHAARLLRLASASRLIGCSIAGVICVFLLAVAKGYFESSNPMTMMKVLSSLGSAMIFAGFAIGEIIMFYLPVADDAPDKWKRMSAGSSMARLAVGFAADIGIVVLVCLSIDVRRSFYGDYVWLMAPDAIFAIVMLLIAWGEFRAILMKIGVGGSPSQIR
jgi:hypothetical protein